MMPKLFSLTVVLATFASSVTPTVTAEDVLLSGHPRHSYQDVQDIEAMASALRKALSERDRYSFSRDWWQWDRLRTRYVDGGRKDHNALRILCAVFRGLILDWHTKLESKGEGDLFYIFFITTAPGNKPGGSTASAAST